MPKKTSKNKTVSPEALAAAVELLRQGGNTQTLDYGPTVNVENGIPRERGKAYNVHLSLERVYTALSTDLATIRHDQHVFAEEMRQFEHRAEQVFSWLARLREDLDRAFEVPGVAEYMQKRSKQRGMLEGQESKMRVSGDFARADAERQGRLESGNGEGARVEGVIHPMTPGPDPF